MNNTEKIDRYLRGELPEADKTAFEAELNQSAELAAELALQKDMEQFLRKQDRRAALKGQLENMGTEFFKTPPPKKLGESCPCAAIRRCVGSSALPRPSHWFW